MKNCRILWEITLLNVMLSLCSLYLTGTAVSLPHSQNPAKVITNPLHAHFAAFLYQPQDRKHDLLHCLQILSSCLCHAPVPIVLEREIHLPVQAVLYMLSEYSDKGYYPPPFFIRTFFKGNWKYRTSCVLLKKRCG